MRHGIRRCVLAALTGVLAGCATTGTTDDTENFLTIFVDNYQGQAVQVSIGMDTWCQVDARATRHACRFAWAGTGNAEIQVRNPSQNRSQAASAAGVSSGDRLCLSSRATGVQLRKC
ncbi:MAG: hypothetical protein OXI71_16325 [Gemmatimonadota bacterium]|nr:hypothetical protein [Gemmatimonadota bacterium]MYA44222.1 hypothetical protein [Gemmatimonadota bacterium]MYE91832.1 hypothetical protein [Gemmatimonadota bacterium]MYJ11278.1 hypothetical protein [Gemmatimonadota bacterium]